MKPPRRWKVDRDRLINRVVMHKEDKEIIKLTAKEILLYLVDGIVRLEDIFDARNYYKKSRDDYFSTRDIDKREFSKTLYRLKKQKFIKNIINSKKEYIELTALGKNRIKTYLTQDLKITNPKKWDKKWRIVIFDIPNSKKSARDALASVLKRLGFLHLQKSVFVYPFPCKSEIDFLKASYNIGKYIQYIIADSVDTETDILGYFFDENLINRKNTKNK